jgi:nitrogen fixation protein FixH
VIFVSEEEMPKSKNKTFKIIGIIIVVLVIGYFASQYLEIGGSNSQGSSGGQISLETTPNPPTIGQNTFTIMVKDSSGNSVDNAKVDFNINMTTMNMGQTSGTATSQGSGRYAAQGRLSMGGPWRISTTVTMPDGSKTNKDFVVNAR